MPRTKPKQVRIAVALLYAALLVSLVQPFVVGSFIGRPPGVLIAISAVVAILTVFLIEYLSIGRNWARITYFALTFLGFPFSILSLHRHLAEGAYLVAALMIGQLVAYLIAFYLLFFDPGKAWFSPRSKAV